MNKPLLNKTIVITRSVEQSEASVTVFNELGANVILFPTIKITDPDDYNLFDNAIKHWNKFDYLIFTSANAVQKFIDRIAELNILLNFNNIKTIVTGSKTAEVCKQNNIFVNFIPKEYSAANIIENIKNVIKDKNVFIPCSAIARDELSAGLIDAGAIVTKVPVYDVGLPNEEDISEHLELLKNSGTDVFIFTSPSTFKNFLTIMKIENPEKYFSDFIVAAIGTTTEAAIKGFNVRVDIVPKIFTMDSLAEEIINYFANIDLTTEHR